MPTTVQELLERARAAGQRLPARDATVLFSAAIRLAAAQGATLRGRLVQIDDQGGLHLLPFDDQQPESEPDYLAPELLAADAPRKSEPRVQVYAAGVLGCELLTGQPLEQGGVPGGPLGDLLRMAIAPDRRERFGDLTQLHDAVEGVQPRLPGDQEKQLISALRAKAQRWGAPPVEKEALAKVIGQLEKVERAHRQMFERLDRLEEGVRRANDARRKRPSVLLPAAFFGAVAGAAVVGATWSAGMLGAAARPQLFRAQNGTVNGAETATTAPAETQPKPAPAPERTRPAEPTRKTEAPDASVSSPVAPPPVAPASEPFAPDASVAVAHDAGSPDAAAVTAPASAPVTPPAASPPAKKRAPESQVSLKAMSHAVAVSQVKRGDKALEQNQVEEALESYRTALENEPTLPEAFRGLGTAYTLQGNDAKAQQNYERYLQLAPRAPDAADIRRALTELKGRAKPAQE